MNYILFGLITFGVACILYFVLYKSSNTLHNKLDSLTEKAKSANTKEKLDIVWNELIILNKECWHHTYVAKVRIIKTIVETKYEFLKQNKL